MKRLFRPLFAPAALSFVCIASAAPVAAQLPDFGSDGLRQKMQTCLPTPDEDAYLQIPWRLNVMEARAESLRTGKPLFVYEMNGNPLGHT